MIEQKHNLFRKESLERLSSPERLNQLMQVVSPKDWIPLATTSSLVVLVLVWSVVGRIPIAVGGRGMLIQPSRVVEFQSPIDGQLKELNVEVGQCVKKDHVLATIDPAQIKQELQLKRTFLVELNTQNQELSSLEGQRTNQEKQFIQQQRQVLQQRLQDAQALVSGFKTREVEAIQQQRQALGQRLQDARDLAPVHKQRFQNRKQLREAGAISVDEVLEAEKSYRETLSEINDFQAELQELNIRELEAEKSYRETMSESADLRAQLQELESKDKTIEQQNLEAANTRKNQIQEVEQKVAQLELELEEKRQIISQHAGCILELTALQGQFVSPGDRLGSIQVAAPSSQMVAVTYFAVKDGKKIKPGMEVQITPDTVKREQFGGILGTITTVSAFPVTKQGAENLIGNAEVVESLIPKGGAIAVFTQLKRSPSTASGYQWSASGGPQLQMTPGTTTSARVTVEERAPITFVLSILRAASGTY